jgi:hypothetical protein
MSAYIIAFNNRSTATSALAPSTAWFDINRTALPVTSTDIDNSLDKATAAAKTGVCVGIHIATTAGSPAFDYPRTGFIKIDRRSAIILKNIHFFCAGTLRAKIKPFT